jgi:hypothetical protein
MKVTISSVSNQQLNAVRRKKRVQRACHFRIRICDGWLDQDRLVTGSPITAVTDSTTATVTAIIKTVTTGTALCGFRVRGA